MLLICYNQETTEYCGSILIQEGTLKTLMEFSRYYVHLYISYAPLKYGENILQSHYTYSNREERKMNIRYRSTRR